jgi:malonyl-CoA decarboxylase
MNDANKFSLLDRTLKNLRNVWKGIASSEYDESAASMQPDLPKSDSERLLKQMHSCLETRGGEVSARARAAALGRAYLALNNVGKVRFLHVLAENFGVDHEAVDRAIQVLQQTSEPISRSKAEQSLRKTLEATGLKLLVQFNALPEGVKFLVDMRADLLGPARNNKILKNFEYDLKGLLTTWFDVDFLELRRISWDSSSASILEKLIAYEAVHAIESWDDLKNRLDSDRRCFAYFHPRMPEEPLIFVEVALVDEMSNNVQSLLDENAPLVNPVDANTAIFYSISNAQKGLEGISFGNFLIKQVVTSLSNEFEELKTFATLSPLPDFRLWLNRHLEVGEKSLPNANEHKANKILGDKSDDVRAKLGAFLEDAALLDSPEVSEAIKDVLMRLAAIYLAQEKRGEGGLRALDPVAHFHLSNGAKIHRLNWMGDKSTKGFEQSAGLMVNYIYELRNFESNHEAYTSIGKIAMSSSLRSLL